MRTDSSYVIGARTVKAATFHNHVDACTHALVRHLCTLTASSATPHKVYPVSHLQLGPQVTSAQFSRIYASLPNFHAIRNATYEAFATGTMGATMDYDHQVAVLEAASRFPNAGVMTEVEEDILAIEDGRVTFDAGPTPFTLDLTRFRPWEHARVQDAPLWELHHGIGTHAQKGDPLVPADWCAKTFPRSASFRCHFLWRRSWPALLRPPVFSWVAGSSSPSPPPGRIAATNLPTVHTRMRARAWRRSAWRSRPW